MVELVPAGAPDQEAVRLVLPHGVRKSCRAPAWESETVLVIGVDGGRGEIGAIRVDTTTGTMQAVPFGDAGRRPLLVQLLLPARS